MATTVLLTSLRSRPYASVLGDSGLKMPAALRKGRNAANECSLLLTNPEILNDFTVALDIAIHQVIEKATALTDEL